MSVLIMTRKMPEIIEVDSQQLEELLARAESNTLREEDAELIRRIFASYVHFFQIVGDKRTTISRLRKMLFGASTEKADKIVGQPPESPDSQASCASEDDPEEGTCSNPDDGRPTRRGHGRHGARDYPGARHVQVPHPQLCAGDECPECRSGSLYEKAPKVIIRFKSQAPVQATVYHLHRLRCHLCGKTFTTPAPQEISKQKYDHTVATMIGLLKYGSGLPFNRLQRLQRNFGVPLAASTQWGIVHAAVLLLAAAYEELIRQAAQGEVLHNDDTTVKILELMGARAKHSPPPDDPHHPDRTGLFTSGVVSTCAGHRIALFFSGRQHAGENLSDVLQHRAQELDAPIHMCDGLSRNLPQELETILANCLVHGRRKFTDLYDRFEDECRHVINAFKVIYHNDKVTRDRGMSADERLLYHQMHSRPTMDDLQQWLQRQFDEKRVEPNSALGEAITYLLKRWDSLTLFLRKAGAPLDNNLCERALKKAILHRKNSYFYKTRNGARVGDIYMSLIYTCELNGVDAFDYLNQLQLNAEDVTEHPDRWMPWNYRETLAAAAEQSGSLLPDACVSRDAESLAQ
jgi:transposase